jgi:hypothetical protein
MMFYSHKLGENGRAFIGVGLVKQELCLFMQLADLRLVCVCPVRIMRSPRMFQISPLCLLSTVQLKHGLCLIFGHA